MNKVYIVFSDGRENDVPVLGVYLKKSDAYKRLGKYHREKNTMEELDVSEEITDEELGHADLNAYRCIIGGVEEYQVN